jgi:SAM-dependent methyltransferase
MEHVPCALCGADETRPELRREEWTLVRCRRCDLVYLDPRPEPEVIAEDYDWVSDSPVQTRSRRRRENPLRTLLRKARGKGILRRKPRQQKVLERIAEFVPGGRLLDVGCGHGDIVEAAGRAGYDAHGIDVSELAVAKAHERGRTTVRRGTIQDAPYPEGHFDAVLLMSYLEHEPAPAGALGRCRSLLRPGGHLFVKVPHYGSWNRRFMGRSWSGYFFPQHLYYFTPATLARLFRKCGFETVRNGFWDHVPFSDVLWATARRPA